MVVVLGDFSGGGLMGGSVIVEIEGFEALEDGRSAIELGFDPEIGVGVVVKSWFVGGEPGGEGDGENHEVEEEEEKSGG